jgi:hypothetical protein
MTLEAALADAVGNAVRKVVRGEVVLRASPAFDAPRTPLVEPETARITKREGADRSGMELSRVAQDLQARGNATVEAIMRMRVRSATDLRRTRRLWYAPDLVFEDVLQKNLLVYVQLPSNLFKIQAPALGRSC